MSKGLFANQCLKSAKKFTCVCSCPKTRSLRNSCCPAQNRGCSGARVSHQHHGNKQMPCWESPWSQRHTYGQKCKQNPKHALKPWPKGGQCELLQHSLLYACKETTIPFNVSDATQSMFLKLSIISHWDYHQRDGEGLTGTWRLRKDIIRRVCMHGATQPVWERNTQGRSKKLLELRLLNPRWAFTDPCSTCLSHFYKYTPSIRQWSSMKV